mgnify:CR=1 FL=1
MVQQLSLVSHIDDKQLNKLLLTLQALTGTKPFEIKRHTIILKPRNPFLPDPIPGKINQIESYKARITRIWNENDGYPLKGDSIINQNNGLNESIWTLQISDIPAGGENNVLIQNIYETTIYKTDDIIGYLEELGYMHEVEFWVKGWRFYYNNIIFEISKLLLIDNNSNNNDDDIINIDNESTNNTNNLIKLKDFDDKGVYSIKAFVNISSFNDLESVAIGKKNLLDLKSQLQDLIDLHIPDRLLMDSRINYTNHKII